MPARRKSKPKQERRANLRQYILYLNKDMDRQLIDYLEPFIKAKRMNAELRRLLYAGLTGSAPAPVMPPRIVPPLPNEPLSLPDEDQDQEGSKLDARQKQRKAFGRFD